MLNLKNFLLNLKNFFELKELFFKLFFKLFLNLKNF